MKDLTLLSQVFYNMLIEPLNEIKSKIKEETYSEALLKIFSIKTKLALNDYHPFPAYQDLLARFQIREKVNELALALFALSKNEKIEENKNNAIALVNKLQAFSHVLNMLSIAFTNPDEIKTKIVIGTAIKLRVIGKTYVKTSDCQNNSQFFKSSDEKKQPSPISSDYHEVLRIFSNFQNTSLQQLCENIFSTMDCIEKKSFPSEEKDLFKLAYIERFTTLSNQYKENFKKWSEGLNQPDEENEGNNISNEDYEKINEAFMSFILKK